MPRIVSGLVASVLLCIACVPKVTTIPDPTVPHQVAKETEVEVWVRRPDGKKQRQEVRLLEGWWIAGPPVVEAEVKGTP